MNNNFFKSNFSPRHRSMSFTGFVLAVVVGAFAVTGSGAVQAQSTSGSIFGKVPAGDTIVAKSTTTGIRRHTTANSNGHYSLKALPVGSYNVVLEENGKPVIQRLNVPVGVAKGTKVDFDCPENKCGAQ